MKVKTVGVLATETTVKEKLYDNVLKKNGITILYPTRIEQNNVNKIIVEILKGKQNKIHEKEIKAVCLSLYKKGAEAILLLVPISKL